MIYRLNFTQCVVWGILQVGHSLLLLLLLLTYTQKFFSAIKKRVPDAVIDVLMTDDGQRKWYLDTSKSFYKTDSVITGGCVAVYPKVTHLLHRWPKRRKIFEARTHKQGVWGHSPPDTEKTFL